MGEDTKIREELLEEIERLNRLTSEQQNQRDTIETLRTSEQWFRMLVENSADVIQLLTHDAIILYESPSVERVLGYRPEEMVGRQAADFVHPEDVKLVAEAYTEFRDRPGAIAILDVRVRHQDGNWRWMASISTNRLHTPEIGAIVVNFHDITDHKRVEQKLQETEQNLRQIIDAIPYPIFCKDQNGRLIFANPRFTELIGLPSGDMIGLPQSQWIPRDDYADAYLEDDREVIASGVPKVIPEEPFIDRNGGLHIFRTTKSPFTVAGTEDPAILGISVEMTELKRAEQRLRAQLGCASVLAGAHSLDEAAPQLLEAACRALDWEFGALWLVQESDAEQELQCRAVWQSPGISDDEFAARSKQLTFKRGKGLPGYIWETGAPYWQDDISTAHKARRYDASLRAGLHAGFAVPVQFGGKLLGVLEFFSSRIQEPDRNLIATITAIGTQIAQFIDRDRTEEARRRSERERNLLLERLQVHIERMPIAYLMSGEDFRYTRWNPAAERMFGWREEEILGRHPFEVIVPPENQVYVEEIFERLRNGAVGVSGANECLTKSGRRIYCEWSNTPLFDGDGRFVGIVSMAEDVTERAKMQEALQTSEARYRTIVETTHEGIWTIDAQLNTTFTNHRMAEMLGETPEGMLGRSLLDFVLPQDAETFGADLERMREGPPEQRECRLRRSDGSTVWVLLSASPLRDDEGGMTGMLLIAADITERRALEEQFRQAQKMEAIGRLAGGVAHDFNNLLTIISGYSELLLGRLPAQDPLTRLVMEIKRAGERAAGLTRQLLAFSRKSVLEPKLVDLNGVISESAGMIRRLVGEDVEFRTTLEPRLGRVRVDPGQIDQVILNLVINSRDAMPQGGRLTIETQNIELDASYAQMRPEIKPGQYVMLAVSDTGTGMSEEIKARIFEPFFTTKTKGKGTGLGLATVYGIVRQSGGHINVYSEIGQGTSFKLYLPRVAGAVAVKMYDRTTAPARSGHETILLVEDEEALRAFARQVLQSAGYTVLEAGNGPEALALLEEYHGQIHLLVTDVVMPQMSGRQLAERLLATRFGLKVLYISGYTDDAVVRHGVLQAEVAFLQKPFSPAALTAKVRAVLDQRG